MKARLLLLGLLACITQAMAEPQVRVETRLLPQAPYHGRRAAVATGSSGELIELIES